MILDSFLNVSRKIITPQFWDEISVFNRIILSVSGGIDSTFLFLAFQAKGIPFECIWNNTGRELRTSLFTLSKIFSYGNLFTITYPETSQKLITKKTRIALKRINQGEISKNKKNIPCCYYLKEKPFNQWIKYNTDLMDVLVSGLAPYEGMQRNIRLGELRNRKTYLRFIKASKRWFAYPLRDLNFQADRKYLEAYVNQYIPTSRSGCITCPIIALWEDLLIEHDEKRLRQSLKAYKI